MSSCRLVHPGRRSELRSCGYNVEQFSELPQDILVDEILLRLPVKYLIRFTVVCKFWYDLIRSPHFMSLRNKSSKNKRVPFYFDSDGLRGCNLTTDITLGFFDTNVPPLKQTVPLRAEKVRLVGCCNGIVCLSLTYGHDTFALWNPATTQSRLINLSHPRGANWIYAGFFFDSVADSCKLVRTTFSERQKPEVSLSGTLSIFTLNDNKWRNKELPVPCRIPGGKCMSQVTCLETCMYWIVTSAYLFSDQDKYILCLDVVDEVFKPIIELPSADDIYCDTELFDYKGSLATFVWASADHSCCFLLPCNCFDMWVLNDDCGGTWRKQLTLGPSMEKPLGIISKEGNDLVLLSTYLSGQFLLWDTDSGKTTKVITRNGWICPIFLYSESFASVY